MKLVEKLKLIRKVHDLTQAQVADSIGMSRGNYSGIENGKIKPTQLFINCISLTYKIDKTWLLDDNNDDLTCLDGSDGMRILIMLNYDQLEDKYKKFVENQIDALIKLQNTP